MIGKDMNAMKKIFDMLDAQFKITRQQLSSNSVTYLKLQIRFTTEGIFINQSEYVKKMLKRIRCEDVNPVFTPIKHGIVRDKNSFVNDKHLIKLVPYREAIGSLLYLATMLRPDISFCLNYLSRFNKKPMTSHWKMVKRVFQYLKGTVGVRISFNGNKISDSGFSDDSRRRKSTNGVLLLRGGPLIWLTQMQRLVATSSAEAEYRAAVSTSNEVSWICRLATELNHLDPKQLTTLCIDNKLAIHMLKNAGDGKVTKSKKHIEISRKFISNILVRSLD